MIYHFSLYLKHYWPFFNVFHYVSVRAIASLLSSLGLFLFFGNRFIAISEQFFRSKTREFTPSMHKSKDNIPIMGGVFILTIALINALLWTNLRNPEVWIFLGCLIGFGCIGCLDDWSKIKKNKGISAKTKFFLQSI